MKRESKREDRNDTGKTPPPPDGRPKRAFSGWEILVLVGVAFAAAAAVYQVLNRPPEGLPPPSDAPSDTPLRPFKVVNAHEHLFSRKYLDKYLNAAEKTGIARTLFVASSEYTLMGARKPQDKGNDENTEEILAAAREHPGRIIPFCAIHPNDPEKLDKIKRFREAGAMGLKLYTGHGNFYDKALDDPGMIPVYQYCAETKFPICWHVNITKYADEFERVMKQFPEMIVIVPHFGVTFFRPREEPWRVFQRLMDTYPNLYTDTSFGTRTILVDGFEAVSRDPEPFREFLKKYADRTLFGTDMVVTGNKEKTEPWIADVLRACREMLEKDAFRYALGAKGAAYAPRNSRNEAGVFRGLALDDDTLRKIYETNMERLFPSK
ncbi:MAG TPA: amidohydrolase family protein [Candidatus Hydrogenedentes bacterium]|nr:amidohydrolase family protein [Candidatus Hydrogenedentota bacterium]